MKIIKSILAMLMAAFSCSEYCCNGAVEVQVHDDLQFSIFDFRLKKELPVIAQACERNNCKGDNFIILLAIRRAENGGWGREFGIKHRLCQTAIEKEPQRSLDIQAGWAAATIVKNRHRWELAGRPGSTNSPQAGFIDFLGDRYCPASADPKGNENWKVNVKYFYKRFIADYTEKSAKSVIRE